MTSRQRVSISPVPFVSHLLTFLLLGTNLFAVYPIPSYDSFPCVPATENCGGGFTFPYDNVYQRRIGDGRSSRDTCSPVPDPNFGGYCDSSCGQFPWCVPPLIIGISHEPITSDGLVRLKVEYDVKQAYCQLGSTAPQWPAQNWIDRLRLFSAGGTELQDPVPVIYEHGYWMPVVNVGSCPGSLTVTVEVDTCGTGGTASQSYTITLNQGDCNLDDKRPCPKEARGGKTSAGDPINVGSGNVSRAEPLFSLAQSPMALDFTLYYNSAPPRYALPVTQRSGLGWTHPFAQSIKDVGGGILHHFTAEGFDSEYKQSGSVWNASRPADLRGQITLVSGEYRLTDLDGTVTAFDQGQAGRWKSTTDRWSNQIAGTYDGNAPSGKLTTITDSVGRQVVLTYDGNGRVKDITLPDGWKWRFEYETDGRLKFIYDSVHLATTPWRKFTYQANSLGENRLLLTVKDEADVILEQHTYDGLNRGTSSSAEGGRENVTVEYSTPGQGQSRVRHTVDATTTEESIFTLLYQGGKFLPKSISGTCASCGGGSDSQSFTFTPDNSVLSRTDGGTSVTSYSYNQDGNPLTVTEAAGDVLARTTTFEYNYAGWPNFVTRLVQPSAAKGGSFTRETQFSWTGTPAETQLTISDKGYLNSGSSSQTVYVTTQGYDGNHRPTTLDGPRGAPIFDVTSNEYYANNDTTVDLRGRLKKVTDPTTFATTYSNYDVFGNPLTLVDPNGVTTARTSDGRGRIRTSVSKQPASDPTEPADYTTTYTYDGRDRLTALKLPRSTEIHYTYEPGANRLTDTIRADSTGLEQERLHLTLNTIQGKAKEENQLCSAPANPCTSWATARRTESFKYDGHNRLMEIDHPDGSKRVFGYDSRGNLLALQDERHVAATLPANTVYAYDVLNRLKSVTQKQSIVTGSDVVTQYSFDALDNMTSVIDANGTTTSYEYDDFRRLYRRQNDPVSGTTTYSSYDEAGNVLTVTDGNGNATTRLYDAANRPISAGAAGATDAPETVSWTYDDATLGNYGVGRLSSMTDPSGATKYTYERRGLLKSERRALWDSQQFLTAFAFDANGNRTSLRYPSGRVVSYTYDYADRQVGAQSSSPTAQTYVSGTAYEPFGPIKQITYGNGTVRDITWTTRYLIQRNKVSKSGASIADVQYGMDVAGNITSLCESGVTCPGTLAGYDRSYVYDDLNRLTTAKTGSSLWGNGATNGYSYDPMGNVSAAILGTSGTYRKLTFTQSGVLAKLASVSEEPPAPATVRSVQYDSAGNETQVGSTPNQKSYEYSARGLLGSGEGFMYAYDGRGVRAVTRLQGLAITSLSPSAGPGGTGVTLLVGGTGFLAGTSQVWWNNAAHATTFTSPTEVSAVISSAEMPAAGLPVSVQVKNGAAASNTVSFVTNFTDVPASNAFYSYVVTIAGRGISGGCGGGNYCPSSPVTRQQMAVFLLKATEGSTYVPPGCTPPPGQVFADVPCPSQYADWIQELSVRGITGGCGAGNYCPTTSVTRGQMAVFLLKTLEGTAYAPPPATGTVFADVTTSTQFAAWIEEVAHRGIAGGCGAGNYCPTSAVTRGQMAVFLTKTFGFTTAFSPGGLRRGFIYSPELTLLSETEYADYATSRKVQILHEYVWLNGTPVAQIDMPGSGGTVTWTATDHIGAPFMQTGPSSSTPIWRAEYEPYGRIWSLRNGAMNTFHQPLRFPGQEAEQLPELGENGATERFYNVFRWYRFGWGRYTQPDPLGIRPALFRERDTQAVDADLFSYALDNPGRFVDASGLAVNLGCMTGVAGRTSQCYPAVQQLIAGINRMSRGTFNVSCNPGDTNTTPVVEGPNDSRSFRINIGEQAPGCRQNASLIHELGEVHSIMLGYRIHNALFPREDDSHAFGTYFEKIYCLRCCCPCPKDIRNKHF